MFPGCTSSTICSSALAAAQEAILFTNSVPELCCWTLTGLTLATTLAPILLSYGFTPRVRHPPVRPPVTSALSVPARLLITLGLRICLRVSQLPQELTAGRTSLQPRLLSYSVCALLLPP
jgi:hypothetical protein